MFSLRLRSAAPAFRAVNNARAFSVSSRVMVASGSEVSNNDPAILEKEKHKNLNDQQDKSPHPESAPRWNEALASESEAVAKADQAHGVDAKPGKDLQDKTVEHVKKVHGH